MKLHWSCNILEMILFWGNFFKRCVVQLLSTYDHGFKIQSLEIPSKIVLVCVRNSRNPIPSLEWVVLKQGKHKQVLQCIVLSGGGDQELTCITKTTSFFFRPTLKKSQDFWKWSGSAELLVTSNASSLLKKAGVRLPGHNLTWILTKKRPFWIWNSRRAAAFWQCKWANMRGTT